MQSTYTPYYIGAKKLSNIPTSVELGPVAQVIMQQVWSFFCVSFFFQGGGKGERSFLIDSHFFLPVLNSFIIGFFFLQEDYDSPTFTEELNMSFHTHTFVLIDSRRF